MSVRQDPADLWATGPTLASPAPGGTAPARGALSDGDTQRLAELHEATALLARALTVEEVSEAFLSLSERVFGAAAGVVYLLDEEGRLRLKGGRGVPELAERFSEISRDAPLPLAEAIRTRSPVWYRGHAALIERYPALAGAKIPSSRLQALAAYPLLHGDRLLGGFALSFAEPRAFDAEERGWFGRFASQYAVAVERARLYTAEREARAEAESLLRVAASLSSTQMDLEAIVQKVTDEATALVGAEFGAFFYNVRGADNDSYLLYTLSGAPREAFAKFGLPRKTPLFATTFEGQGIVRIADVRRDPRYGKMGPHHGMAPGHLPVVSYLAVPVFSRDGQVLGGLLFGHPEADRFSIKHERLVAALAANAAAAIDNAKLYQQSRAGQETNQRLVEELKETLRLNDLLAGVLAHDLRNPLSAILTSADLALATTSDERLTRTLSRIVKSGQRMGRMVEQLLDFARLRLGEGMPIEPKPGDIEPLLRQVIDELDGVKTDAPIRVEHRGDTRGVWDADRLSQVFSNLLGNAVEHGAEGPVEVSIDGESPNQVRVRVHNRGAVPPEMLPMLFQPLAGGQQRRTKSRGLGLGLFITREIVRAHGGQVEVTSSETTGTSMIVSLPRVASGESPPRENAVSTGSIRDARERAFQSEQRMRLLVNSVRDYAIFMLDSEGRIQTWNAGAYLSKGYLPEEILGRHISTFYTEEDRRNGLPQRLLQQAIAEGRVENEGWRVRKDGSRFWADVVITAFFDSGGELRGFAKVTRDLTERRRLEEERVRLAQAEEGIRLRDEFLSVVSHELKTPLSGLQLQLEAMQRQSEPSDQKTALRLGRAVASGARLAALIESLLDTSRLATGRFSLSLSTFDLARAVAEVLEGLSDATAKAGCEIRLRVESPDGAPVVGTWDRVRLEQVLVNLLSNAMKYGAGKPVDVIVRSGPTEAVLEVRDGGPGLPPEALGRVFDRFERAASIRHYAGLGLGLFLVQEIAKVHGGAASVCNLPQGGAAFTVRLPRFPTGTPPVDSATSGLQS